jgi:hypothetical protein
MKWALTLMIVTCLAGPAPAAPGPSVDPVDLAARIATEAGWAESGSAVLPAGEGFTELLEIEREQVAGDVYHYRFEIRVGPGPYDVIGFHRVVRERRPGRPIRTRRSIFLVHGSGMGFENSFLAPESAPPDHSLPAWLAAGDVDVWGMDAGWTRVPSDAVDFTAFADWGGEKDADHLGIALAVAQSVRTLTGSGARRMHLLSWSRGVLASMIHLGRESQWPPGLRHVDGYIAVDSSVLKTDDETMRLTDCAQAAHYQSLIDAGTYQDQSGILVNTLGLLARIDPDGASPIVPGFTNMQLLLYWGAATAVVLGGEGPFHLVAGAFDGFGVPTGFQFVPVERFLDFADGWAPFQPNRVELDLRTSNCDEVDVSWDDHLADITNPILFIGAGGGIGPAGNYVNTLVGSDEVASLIVSTAPVPEIDFGHVDLFYGTNAPELVWQPILDWIDSRAAEGDDGTIASSPGVAPDVRIAPNPGPSDHYRISFVMAVAGDALVDVYDVAGRRVTRLLDSRLGAGRVDVSWDARPGDGSFLAPGVYFVRVSTPAGATTAKLVHGVR